MQSFHDQIDRERRKIALLKVKIADCEARITALLSVQEEDELDRILDKELLASSEPLQDIAKPSQESRVDDKQRVKRVPENWVALINFLGEEGKSSAEVAGFLAAGGAKMTPAAARTGLMNYRKDFGFVESPRKGFYKATKKGLEAVGASKSESLALTSEAF